MTTIFNYPKMITNVKLEEDFLVFDINNVPTLKIRLDKDINMKHEGYVVTYTTGSYTIIHESKVPFLETYGWGRHMEIKDKIMRFKVTYDHGCIETSLLKAVSAYWARQP